jgi:diguanylate cyclase (GGDEF)-like protein
MLDNLTAMAEHDGLTGLYNRTYFQQELDRVVDCARRTGQRYSLLYIDLDNFKFINDTLGHAVGDRLLGEISKELLKRARQRDLVARFGGDEFTVLLYDIDPKLSVEVAESFRKRLSDYVFVHGGEAIQVGCSIGAAVIGAESTSAEEALSRADLSCHLAKRSGRNRIHLFNPADHADVATMTADMGWSRRIKHAIDNGRFALACQPIVSTQDRTLESFEVSLACQPIVSTQDRTLESFEVLIRMLDKDESLIMPGGLLATAERFGLATDIDRWVIVHGIDNLIEQRRTAPNTRYSINLSAQTLSDPFICDFIIEKLETSGLDPTALTFEVTETAAIADMNVAAKLLSRLQRIGCKTALDDFGSGMPSFAYLKDLPVDIVKIDGHFVKQLDESPVDQAIVKGINEIVHALGKKTVAEFVENEESFRLVAAYGVDYAQGYYLGRPEPKGLCTTASTEQKSS